MKPVTDAVPDIGVRARRFSLRSPPAWCVVQWPINCSHKGKISIFPGTKIARLIAAAGKPCSPHLLTTLSFIPFCFFPVSLSANHQALQVFFFLPPLSLFHVSLLSTSNHSVFIKRLLCELRRRTRRERRGLGMRFGMPHCWNRSVSLQWCSHNQHTGAVLLHRTKTLSDAMYIFSL